MTVRITRRPTLVDGVAQAGRWWWRHWERFMEAGRGGGRGTTAFTAEGAEDAEYVGVEEDVGYAVAEDARFRNLTGRSFLNFGYSASSQGASSGDPRLDDPTRSNEDHPPQRVQRVEATREDCPESLPPRRRSIRAPRSVGSDGSMVERSTSASSAPSAVKRSSTPTPDPEAAPCH